MVHFIWAICSVTANVITDMAYKADQLDNYDIYSLK